MKLWRPGWFDASALCVGSAVPDLIYPFVGRDGHSFAALVIVVPITMLIVMLLRRRAAAVVFPQFPDLGDMRLHSYAVIGRRRPSVAISLGSALIGALSHIVIDAFTHDSRWGARWLGLDHRWVALPIRGEVSLARALQYGGHTVGSLIGLLLFWYIGRQRLLERWYGSDNVRSARSARPTVDARVRFWSVSLGIALVVAVSVQPLTDSRVVFSVMAGMVIGLLAAGSMPALVPVDTRVERSDGGSADAEAPGVRED